VQPPGVGTNSLPLAIYSLARRRTKSQISFAVYGSLSWKVCVRDEAEIRGTPEDVILYIGSRHMQTEFQRCNTGGLSVNPLSV